MGKQNGGCQRWRVGRTGEGGQKVQTYNSKFWECTAW